MTYTGIASTTDVDLDKDRIVSWDMEPGQKYKKPMFWQHDTYSAPVADGDVWVDMDPTTNAPVLLISFDMFDTDDAEALTKAINDGAITSLSVGFSVSEENYAPNEAGGYNFWKAHLTEVSIVLNPANPNAIIDKKMVASKSENGKKDIFVKMSTSFAAKTITKSLDDPDAETDQKADVPSTEETSSEPDEIRVTDDQETKSTDQEPNEVESLQKTVDELKKSIEDLKSVAKSEKDGTMKTKTKDTEKNNVHANAKFKSVSETNKHKEPTKMANNKKVTKSFINNELVKFSKTTNGGKAHVKDFMEYIKSIELPDGTDMSEVVDIFDNRAEIQNSYLSLLPAPKPSVKYSTMNVDLKPKAAQMISHRTGLKPEQLIKFTKREITESSALIRNSFSWLEMVEDTSGEYFSYTKNQLDRQMDFGLTQQILVGNPDFSDKSLNESADQLFSEHLVPIATDSAYFTTQLTWSEPSFIKLAKALTKIMDSTSKVVVMNATTAFKVGMETGSDGHFLLGAPVLEPDALGAALGAKVVIVSDEILEDGHVIAHDIDSYRRNSIQQRTGIADYNIDYNNNKFERVEAIGGSLKKALSAVNIVIGDNSSTNL